ncbi:MAG TPA: HAD family hydrolase [Hypericibacter adhaerens]|uniref:Haloacid dehalogenase n=1 Tax=Hypericibacter adhaerens TaxID=2602016 RepID=A0A5J6N6Q9_9PROT|nr:HAD family hydrolase [Hypericibacter adhaerens]QEX25277.1 haloacid dehalogenase [Hypericibacter adhaerens]HWA44289.1 HAD family hydrolase [Hypericibacter adhaerens]
MPSLPPARPDLVIFDCDGVLIDSELIACRVLSDALGEVGIAIPAEEIAERYVGLTGDAIFADLKARTGRSIPEGFRERTRPRLEAAFETGLQPMPGILALLAALPVRACVASGSPPDRLHHSLAVAGLFDRFTPHIFSAAQVARGKPAPDLFLLAASRMGVAPEACWVVEDSRAGIEAAQAAGMTALGFAGGSHCRDGHPEKLRQAGAVLVFQRLQELADLLAVSR